MSTVSVIYDLIGRDSASKAFNSAGDSASKFEKTISRIGTVVLEAGAVIAAGAVAVATESVKMAVSFQSSMEKIHTQAGASQAAVDSLTKSVLNMAPSTEQGPQQLADALYHLKSVGLDNANALKALKISSDLAAVGGANLEDTTNALAGAWRSGIKGATDFGTAAATVNAIIGAGNMQMQGFVNAIGTGILPVAKTFGLSLTSIGSALALMTDEGVPAVDAATRLKTAIPLLGAPSATAAKALATIGVSGLQLANAMRSPQGLIAAIGLLKQHLDASGMSASEQAIVISRAFGGGHTGAAIMTLLNNFDVLEQKQKQINTTIGKYGPAVAAQRQTAAAQFALLRSAVDTLGIRLGLDLLPPVTKFVTFVGSKAVPAISGFATKILGMLPVKQIQDDAGKIIGTIENLLGLHKKAPAKPVVMSSVPPQLLPQIIDQPAPPNLFTGMADSLMANLTSAWKKINWGKLLADVIQGAVSGAQQIGAAFLMLLGKIDWTSLGDQFATAVVGLAIGLVNNLVPALIGEAVHHPLDMLSFLLALIPIGRAAGILADIFDKIPILGTLTKWILGPIEKLGGVMESALGSVLKKVFGPVGDMIGGFFAKAQSWLLSKGETIILGLWYGAEDSWGTVVKWLGKIPGWVLDVFARADSWLTGKGLDIMAGLFNGAQRGWAVASDWLGGVGSKVTSLFAKSSDWLYGHGQDIIGGLYRGIKDAIADVGSWVMANIVDPIITWVKHWFGINSPSTVMAWIGGHLMGGLFKGMMSHDLTAMVEKIFGSLPGALLHIVEKGLVGLAGLPLKAINALGDLGSEGLNLLGKAWHGITGSGFNAVQMIGQAMAASMGWTGAQWTALQALWQRESGWNTAAVNPKSGAYGIPQALPGSKMASVGADWMTNPAVQIRWGLDYIAGRYGSPLGAWAHEQAFNWYGHGGRFAAGQLIGVGDRGPELISFGQPGRVFSPEESAALLSAAGRGGDGGVFTGQLYLDSGELLGIVEGRIERSQKEIIRAAKSGSGSRR